MGGNYSAFNSFDNTGYLQNYIEEQIKKKRSKLNHYSSDKNYGNILCCSIKEGSFLKPIRWKKMFLYECALIRKKSDYEWTIALPIFLSNFKQIQSEDVFRTDLVLLVFTKSRCLFPETQRADCTDHYEDNHIMSKESDLSFQVPLNSRCWIESPLQQNQNETINNCENSFGIDYFPEKSSPIPKKIIRSYSFSTKSKRFSEMNEDQDSMMYEWKNTYKEIIDVDMNKLLLSTFENKSGFQLYKLALECIERHLNEDKCILGIILKKYTNYILNTYQFMGQVLFDKISNSDLKNVFSKMIADIHCFCQVFQKTLSEFYQLKVLKKKHKEIEEFLNENNLENFVIQLIYQKQDIYDIIYETEKQLAKCFESDFTETKNLLEAIEIKDCFTPFEKTNKMKLLSPNMKTCCEKINEKLIDNFPKGFDNFSYAIDHYKEAFKPFSSYKNLIEGVKYLKNPLEKLMIFSRPRQIIRKFMEDMDYPDFDLIDKRDEIKILFFLIIKSDLMTIFIELNIILATVKAQEKDLRILKILLKCINHLMKLQKKKELVRSLKAEGFLAKMIEKHYLKKMINFSVKK